jgi:hypothetical protein
MRDLETGTLADLATLMPAPARMRRGWWDVVKPANPAGGANYTHTVPAQYWERVVGVAATLTTSNSAAPRALSLAYADADAIQFSAVPLIPLMAASSTATVYGSLSPAVSSSPGAATTAQGSVTDPGAGVAICQTGSLAAGLYQVTATVYLSGTVTDADGDNMGVFCGATPLELIAYPGTTYVPVTFTTYQDIPAGAVANVKAHVAASGAAAIYHASLVLTPLTGPYRRVTLPDLLLKPGSTISLLGSGFFSNDQISGIALVLEHYASNWADGSLGSDEERQARWLAQVIAERSLGM